MKAIVQEQFKAELRRAQIAIAKQDFDTAWTALQRAHILGQRDAVAHTIAHGNMLKLAWKQRDFRSCCWATHANHSRNSPHNLVWINEIPKRG